MNVYGLQRIDDKLNFIDSLVDLRDRHAGIPWIMGGDFNMIKSLSEKKRGTRALRKDSLAFQIFTNNMKLVDIETNNGLFTWNNKRGGGSHVASKLDRFIISEDLMLIGQEIIVRVLPFGGSDHFLVQMEIQGIGTPRNRPFRFENIWLSHPEFISNIEKWWAEDLHIQGTRMFLLHKILKHIKLRLKDWNKNDFGNIFVGKKFVENKMQELNQAMIKEGFDKDKSDQVKKHQQDWENFCKQEEIFWIQKSRVQWLIEGERNTRLFHRSTMANNAHNRISSIKDVDGQIQQSREDIEAVSVTEKEVSEVLKEMLYGKAPVPDGFNVDFFKDCWNIVKQHILNVVEDSRLNKTILKVLNTSFISLIPKQDNAQTQKRYRPIALCNVVYKIISKVVANKLRPLLPTLVSGEQSGYVEGRQILDNIIQAHEVVHSLTSKRKAGMIMQLDIAKAYDKVN
eukprot:PITA_04501